MSRKGARCPDCGAAIHYDSARCRPCMMRLVRQPRPPCPDCGGEKRDRDAPRCRACTDRRKRVPLPTCGVCGVRLGRADSRFCRQHYYQTVTDRADARRICPECDGPKLPQSDRCNGCRLERGALRVDWGGVVRGFSAEWFRRQLDRADMEWTPQLLSEATRGRVARSTIDNWLNGRALPRWSSWRIVAQVLAWEPCGPCGGSGWHDPTARWLRLVPKSERLAQTASRNRKHRARKKEASG